MKAIICIGISGSGKSTFAKQCGLWEINRDEDRWIVSGKKGWNGPDAYKFNSKIENQVTELHNIDYEWAAFEGVSIINSDTNLNPKYRQKLIDNLKSLGYEVEIKEFPISFQEACKRDKERGIFSVGEEVLKKQWEAWCKYFADKEGSNN